MTTDQKTHDYLDHPPQRYTRDAISGMEPNSAGEWVKHKDMDLYMFEGGQLMLHAVAENARLRKALADIARYEQSAREIVAQNRWPSTLAIDLAGKARLALDVSGSNSTTEK